MSAIFNSILRPIIDFLSSSKKRRLLLIGIIALIALSEFFILGLARRTFVFYTLKDGEIAVEDRMLKRARSREENIIRYMEETLLGPGSPDLLPLFPRETRLNSLIFRDGKVYANFSKEAELPPVEGGRTQENFQTLHDGILRNFPYIKEVLFFIESRPIYVEEDFAEKLVYGGV
ncbi:MAG: GerMN domain-containing protein [Treponema sp.]|jgi:hypothetical protein|nr:GerMN domain-containing protein [Treponema sp.]